MTRRTIGWVAGLALGLVLSVGLAVRAAETRTTFVWEGAAPSGACGVERVTFDVKTGTAYCCVTGTWGQCSAPVLTTGAQTVAGVKTFSSQPVAPSVKIGSASAAPTCASGVRGVVYVTLSAADSADLVQVCAKKADNTYAWIDIVTVP